MAELDNMPPNLSKTQILHFGTQQSQYHIWGVSIVLLGSIYRYFTWKAF